MKKIMFNDKFCLTEAVRSGRKTQTRRIIKPQPRFDPCGGIVWKGRMFGLSIFGTMEGAADNFIRSINVGKDVNIPFHVGDEVAVAESYKTIFEYDPFIYASYKSLESVAGWGNKMFVKPEYMRSFVKIVRMELQRLQDITDEDCIAEGITAVKQDGNPVPRGYVGHWKHGEHAYAYENVRDAYAGLVDMISGKGTWESNPWVWVYTFELT